jgi:hypothetical protein
MGSNQGYFCDGKCPDSIAEALFQKDASWNGVTEPLSHIIGFTRLGVLLFYCSCSEQASIFCTVPERKTNLPSLTQFWVTVCILEPISAEK